MDKYNVEDVPVLILAGGRGTRLQSEVSDRAKPMADINGRPFLDLLLERYKNHEIYISVGYMKETIMDYYGDKYTYITEDEPLGTGGAIKKAFREIGSDYLIVLNGDTFTDLELYDEEPTNDVLLNTVFQEDCERYGHVEVTDYNVFFKEKGHSGPGYINSGVYIVCRDAMIDTPEKFSFEDLLKGFHSIEVIQHKDAQFIDIGVPEDYFKAIKQFG